MKQLLSLIFFYAFVASNVAADTALFQRICKNADCSDQEGKDRALGKARVVSDSNGNTIVQVFPVVEPPVVEPPVVEPPPTSSGDIVYHNDYQLGSTIQLVMSGKKVHAIAFTLLKNKQSRGGWVVQGSTSSYRAWDGWISAEAGGKPVSSLFCAASGQQSSIGLSTLGTFGLCSLSANKQYYLNIGPSVIEGSCPASDTCKINLSIGN